ncbi:amidase [Vibrio sp.]|uniref:Amidase n=1 Tax=Vibrio viridaestus TaxID=2487322 RepID=A0A3N9TLG7_9VIBR|nr:amidase [Vibrio viridaestus]MDC0609849.1 amidase [Vibrio sp.]RQW64723.1 amidase [Vibrio viridaestus]
MYHKKLKLSLCIASVLSAPTMAAQQQTTFELNETTIQKISQAVITQKVSCTDIVKSYIDRINQYDKSGKLPINSIIQVNPKALDAAKNIDYMVKNGSNPGSLTCAPLIIKDNIDVKGLATTAGSKALAKNIAKDDATQVERLRDHGAIILAKSNLAEFAWTPDYSESSLGGLTRNPYDVTRTTGGSSGGTAASVAANFGVAGLGTDTGASIRGPSGLQNLVGLRPTLGASSRDGVIPIWMTRDTAGPMARNVTDAALLFEATSGFDYKDSVTDKARFVPQFKAKTALNKHALNGMRVGVLRQMVTPESTDPEVLKRFEQALESMKKQGAILVDIKIPDLDTKANLPWPNRMKYDFNAYLTGQGKASPIKDFNQLVDSGLYVKEVKPFLEHEANITEQERVENDKLDKISTSELQKTLVGEMNNQFVSVVVYPTWTQPPRKLKGLSGDGGNNNSMIAHAGLPAITVPMGFTHGNLPSSLQIAGRPFSESTIVGAAYSFEQTTHFRKPPTSIPPAKLDKS